MPDRLYDAVIANEICNLPGVFDGLMADHAIDFTPTVENLRNVILHDDGGIAVCIASAPLVYECHLFFRPEMRGARALAATRRMVDYMMPDLASILWVQPPRHHKAAQWLARQCGFRFEEIADHALLGQVAYMTKGFA